LSTQQLTSLLALLRNPDSGIRVAAVDLDVAEGVEQIPRDQVPDLPDRIIGATALQMELPLVTADTELQASAVTTIW